HGGAQLAKGKLSPERTKQCQEASICEQEECCVDQSSDSALIHRGDGIDAVRFRTLVCKGCLFESLVRVGWNGHVDHHPCLFTRRGVSANSYSEGEIPFPNRRDVSNSYRGWEGRIARKLLKREFRLSEAGRNLPPTCAIRL